MNQVIAFLCCYEYIMSFFFQNSLFIEVIIITIIVDEQPSKSPPEEKRRQAILAAHDIFICVCMSLLYLQPHLYNQSFGHSECSQRFSTMNNICDIN